MHRFFMDARYISGESVTLTGENAGHAAVLRLSENENIIICDGKGMDYHCRVRIVGRGSEKGFVCDILSRSPSMAEPAVGITFFQGMPKADKLELIIEKCVELGVSEIVPVITRNTIVRPMGDDDALKRKWERYNKISAAAAMQSGRGIIPVVARPVRFEDAVEALAGLNEAYVAYEREHALFLREAFDTRDAGNGFDGGYTESRFNAERASIAGQASGQEPRRNIGFFIGPEGGFTSGEIEICASRGIRAVSLGRRVLRTETAGFMMIITYLYSRGEL